MYSIPETLFVVRPLGRLPDRQTKTDGMRLFRRSADEHDAKHALKLCPEVQIMK